MKKTVELLKQYWKLHGIRKKCLLGDVSTARTLWFVEMYMYQSVGMWMRKRKIGKRDWESNNVHVYLDFPTCISLMQYVFDFVLH